MAPRKGKVSSKKITKETSNKKPTPTSAPPRKKSKVTENPSSKKTTEEAKDVNPPPPHILEGIIPAKHVKSKQKKTDLLCSYLSPIVEAFLKEQIKKLTK